MFFHVFGMALVVVFVFGVLAIVAFALYKMSPLPHRANPYRDSVTGKRNWESPHLDGPPN